MQPPKARSHDTRGANLSNVRRRSTPHRWKTRTPRSTSLKHSSPITAARYTRPKTDLCEPLWADTVLGAAFGSEASPRSGEAETRDKDGPDEAVRGMGWERTQTQPTGAPRWAVVTAGRVAVETGRTGRTPITGRDRNGSRPILSRSAAGMIDDGAVACAIETKKPVYRLEWRADARTEAAVLYCFLAGAKKKGDAHRVSRARLLGNDAHRGAAGLRNGHWCRDPCPRRPGFARRVGKQRGFPPLSPLRAAGLHARWFLPPLRPHTRRLRCAVFPLEPSKFNRPLRSR